MSDGKHECRRAEGRESQRSPRRGRVILAPGSGPFSVAKLISLVLLCFGSSPPLSPFYAHREKRAVDKDESEIEPIGLGFIFFPSRPCPQVFLFIFASTLLSLGSSFLDSSPSRALSGVERWRADEKPNLGIDSGDASFFNPSRYFSPLPLYDPSSMFSSWYCPIKRPIDPDKERAEPEDVPRGLIHLRFCFVPEIRSFFSL